MCKGVKKILQYYVKKENNIKNTEYIFYIHTEYDSNVTDFERLSNENKILLKSKLQIVDISIILKIFQCIYDKNYIIFKKECLYFEEFFYNYFDENIAEIYPNLFISTYENLDIWIDFLTKITTEKYNCEINNSDSEDELKLDYLDTENKFEFDCIEKFKKIPNVIGNSETKQKIFEIKDIIKLIDF